MTALLAALHFVCPLLFFTDLTRNPYFTQIALLNVGLAAAVLMWAARGWRAGAWPWVPTGLEWPWAALLAASAASWAVAYAGHAAFYRPAIASEGLRAGFFLVLNSLAVFYLAAGRAEAGEGAPDASPGPWAALALLWGGAWTFFPSLRGAPSALTTVWPHVWDPAGALLWAGGLAAALWLARRGRTHDLWHLVLATAFLGAVYGIFQYFGVEFFWPRILNPYGGRSVSTFGNPNFMSSYMVVVLPLAVVYYLHAASRPARLAYAAVILALEACLLCSLTRSSWAGAAAAVLPLALSRRLRRLAAQDLEFHGLVAAVAAALLLFWPQSSVEGYAPSVAGRLAELTSAFGASGGQPYSPLHQRLLIWTCAWAMGAENPLTGKGFGLIELFYPFYQGHYMTVVQSFATLRTHANNAHNEVLELFSQTGILGLGAAALMWTAFFARVGASFRAAWGSGPEKARAEGEGEPVWALAAAAGVLGMLVDNLLNVSVHFAVPGLVFWWQAGTAMGLLSRREGRAGDVPAGPARGAAAVGLAGLLALGAAWHWTGQWAREALYFNGFKLMRRGDARGAADILERAYAWHAREVNTNYELGNAYARSEMPDKAVWAYKEALAANAGYDEIYFNLGTLESLRLGRRDEALDHFRLSWAINPMNTGLAQNFAAVLLQRAAPGDREEALEVLERATALEPGNVNLAMTRAGVLSQLGDWPKAAAAFESLLRLQPNFAAAEQGLRQAAAAGRLASPVLGQVEAFRRLEGLIARRDYGDETLRLARAAQAAFPRSMAARFYAGNLELIHGDAAAAAALLEQVVAADASNIGAKLNLAQSYRRLGKTAEAVDMLRRVLAQDPNNAMARQALGAP